MSVGMKLREAVKAHGVRKATEIFREARETKKITNGQIHLRELAETMVGPNWVSVLKEAASRTAETSMRLRESVDAVDASGFSAITGQLLIDTIREKYRLATYVGDQIFTTVKIGNGNLGPQREPYLSDTTDDPAKVLSQGQPYPATAFVGQYVDYPAPEKYGRICRLTFEMVYSDLTGQAIDSATSVGRRVGLWVEKMRLKVAFGLVNNHSWNGTSYNTYQTASPWINKLTDFTLSSWRDMNRVEQLFAEMLDPVLGEPIELDGYQALVMPFNYYNAKRILNATMTRSGNEASDTGNLVEADNPLENYTLFKSKHARKLLTDTAANGGGALTAPVTNSVCLFGDLKRAFVWREVFPQQAVQAPPNSPEEFNQDVVVQVKSNVYGVAGVRDPRFAVYAYNSSAT